MLNREEFRVTVNASRPPRSWKKTYPFPTKNDSQDATCRVGDPMQFRPMNNDEKLLFDEAPTLYGTSPGWFLLWCLLVPVVVGIIALIVWKVSLKNTRLQIRGDRVLFRTGWFSTK